MIFSQRSLAFSKLNLMKTPTFESLPDEVNALRRDVNKILSLLEDSGNAGENFQGSPFLTLIEAATFLKLAPQTIYGLIHNKKIPCIKKGKRVYFTKEQLISWMESGRKKTSDEIAAECHPILFRKGGHK